MGANIALNTSSATVAIQKTDFHVKMKKRDFERDKICFLIK